MPETTKPSTESVRERLLFNSDQDTAKALAGALSDSINDTLNGMRDVGSGTSLLTRALTARALMRVAAVWWNDMMPDVPRDVSEAVLLDIITNPPEGCEGKVYYDPSIVEGSIRRPN
jgi:hypothetical protein